ncbi:hypothetical protein D3C73_1333380 [compost metagenome]
MHHVQHLAGIGQPDLAFRCQPQTTRGARKQAYGQRGLQALDGGTDLGRLDADFARRITKTVKRRGADKQREIFKPEHFHSPSISPVAVRLFFPF